MFRHFFFSLRIFSAVVSIGMILGIPTTHADSWARIVPTLKEGERIPDLEWSSLRFLISQSRIVDLQGSIAEGSFALLLSSPSIKKLPLSSTPDLPGRMQFRLKLRMLGKSAVVALRRIDDFGRVQTERIVLVEVASNDWGPEMTASSKRLNPWHFNLGIGVASQNYNEISSGIHLIESSISGSFSAIYSISRRWIANASANITLIPLSNSLSGYSSARFYGFDARAGYRIPVGENQAFLLLEAGWYSWGMIVPSDAYGVTSLGGPEFYLFSGFNWVASHPIWFYLKFASVESGAAIFSATNRELSGGLIFQLTDSAFTGTPLRLQLSYATTQYSDSVHQFQFSQVNLGLQFDL